MNRRPFGLTSAATIEGLRVMWRFACPCCDTGTPNIKFSVPRCFVLMGLTPCQVRIHQEFRSSLLHFKFVGAPALAGQLGPVVPRVCAYFSKFQGRPCFSHFVTEVNGPQFDGGCLVSITRILPCFCSRGRCWKNTWVTSSVRTSSGGCACSSRRKSFRL